jgi:hypothetical protein
LVQEDLFELAARFDWKLAGDRPVRLTPGGVLVPAGVADEEARVAREVYLASQGRAAPVA